MVEARANIKDLCHITRVADVYGTDNPTPPRGYEFTGEFRPPSRREFVLSIAGNRAVRVVYDWMSWGPLLILKQIEKQP